MLCSVMKITFRNYSMPSEAITIYVQHCLNALSRLHPIRSANLLITRGPPDSLSYQVRAELHLGGWALVEDAGSHSFRGAFERILQILRCFYCVRLRKVVRFLKAGTSPPKTEPSHIKPFLFQV